MRSQFTQSNHAARILWRLVFWTMLAIMLLLATYKVASA